MSDRSIQRTIALSIHTAMNDPQMTATQRERAAATARRLADVFKRYDGTFCYEWFYGACGLDPWGDVISDHRLELKGRR